MTIEVAIAQVKELIDNNTIPFWARPSLQKVMETVESERERHTEERNIGIMEVPTVDKILEFGQGNDDIVFELFSGIHNMMKGYYTLVNYGDNWWEGLNQDIWCDQEIEDAWNKVDWDMFEGTLDKTFKIMCGSYVIEDRFFNALSIISEKGIGYRPNRKE